MQYYGRNVTGRANRESEWPSSLGISKRTDHAQARETLCLCRTMPEVTQILAAIEQGQASADQLLPLVYDELRRLAAARLAQERPGQTLQATALVHEAWLRLVGFG